MPIRDVVTSAHNFIESYRSGPSGNIDSKVIPQMKHMLAHCFMTSVLSFLNSYGIKNPGEFADMLDVARNAGWIPPDEIKRKYPISFREIPKS